MNLISKSIDIIKQNQSETGAYVASPNFESYDYSWFRDGAYIAYSMCITGEYESARKFHMWCADVMERYKGVAQSAIDRLQKGEKPDETQFLPTRFSLDGKAVEDEWTNFQTDGFGTWLWSVAEYIRISGDHSIINDAQNGIKTCIEYLLAVWNVPCYDCWEEFLDYVHTYTLGSIYAGLQSVSEYFPSYKNDIKKVSSDIEQYIQEHMLKDSQLIKMKAESGEQNDTTLGVDASLLGMMTPYNMFPMDSDIGKATIERIEKDIYNTGGGVYRYLQDTYFGGGEWILLACWLGWCYAEAGQKDKAQGIVGWVENNADTDGQLPEQVLNNVFDEEKLVEWEQRWGKNAQPLLWSHAMYIILKDAVKKY